MYLFLKGLLDRIVALCSFLVLMPVFILLSLFLLIDLKGNPYFTQIRIGKDDKKFRLIKFRTMTSERDSDGKLLPDNIRLTKLGIILRRLSLDELPQLLNVIYGHMSIVGPRPLLTEYLPLYNLTQKRRHEVKPGITGLAQVNGRNSISWEEKFDFDVKYVDNINPVLDVRILLSTILKVFRREDISSDTSVTMEKFKGSI